MITVRSDIGGGPTHIYDLILGLKNIEPKIFNAISALTSGNKKEAVEHFYKVLKSGEDWTRVFAMIVYQFRSMLKVKSLQDDNVVATQMAKVLKMHPFAVKKILPHASRYSMDRLKQIYKSLLEADFNLKTGRVSFQVVLERLILEI